MHKFYLPAIVLALSVGCGDSSGDKEDAPANLHTMDFDIITSGNTISGGSGHFSVTYQATKTSDEKPVSGLNDPSVTYTLYENDFETSESRLLVEPNPKSVSNHILLMLDLSGSVAGDCEGIDRQLDASSGQYIISNPYEGDVNNLCNQLVTSAKEFVDTVVNANQRMAIYYFNSRSQVFPLIEQPTENKELLKEGLNSLFSQEFRDLNLKGYISTNLYGAVVEATKIACQWVDDCNYPPYTPLQQENPEVARLSSVVVFTDGRELAGRVSAEDMFEFIDLHKDSYYYTIGLGNVDDAILEQIGKDGFFKVVDVADLNGAFAELGIGLDDWANSFYKVDFCPTQQTGESAILLKIDDSERGLYGELSVVAELPENIDLRCDL